MSRLPPSRRAGFRELSVSDLTKTKATEKRRSTATQMTAWSPSSVWCGDLPAEYCELALYALLWLDTVALPKIGGPKASRADSCALLLQQPSHWRKIEAMRKLPIPIATVLAAAAPPGSARHTQGAMEVLGPVVYAWLQHEVLLHGVDGADVLGASWHGAALTPRQLFVYLETANDGGRRGAKLRANGGSTCRWALPRIVDAWQELLFETPGVGTSMVRLLALPLSMAQEAVFRTQALELPQLQSPPGQYSPPGQMPGQRSPPRSNGSSQRHSLSTQSPPPQRQNSPPQRYSPPSREGPLPDHTVASRQQRQQQRQQQQQAQRSSIPPLMALVLDSPPPPEVSPLSSPPLSSPLGSPLSSPTRGAAQSLAAVTTPHRSVAPPGAPSLASSLSSSSIASSLASSVFASPASAAAAAAAATARQSVPHAWADLSTEGRELWARQWGDGRRVARALGRWQRKAKDHALRLAQQAFDRHVNEVNRAAGSLVRSPGSDFATRLASLRALRHWHYASSLQALSAVRRARLALAMDFYSRNELTNALLTWRASSILDIADAIAAEKLKAAMVKEVREVTEAKEVEKDKSECPADMSVAAFAAAATHACTAPCTAACAAACAAVPPSSTAASNACSTAIAASAATVSDASAIAFAAMATQPKLATPGASSSLAPSLAPSDDACAAAAWSRFGVAATATPTLLSSTTRTSTRTSILHVAAASTPASGALPPGSAALGLKRERSETAEIAQDLEHAAKQSSEASARDSARSDSARSSPSPTLGAGGVAAGAAADDALDERPRPRPGAAARLEQRSVPRSNPGGSPRPVRPSSIGFDDEAPILGRLPGKMPDDSGGGEDGLVTGVVSELATVEQRFREEQGSSLLEVPSSMLEVPSSMLDAVANAAISPSKSLSLSKSNGVRASPEALKRSPDGGGGTHLGSGRISLPPTIQPPVSQASQPIDLHRLASTETRFQTEPNIVDSALQAVAGMFKVWPPAANAEPGDRRGDRRAASQPQAAAVETATPGKVLASTSADVGDASDAATGTASLASVSSSPTSATPASQPPVIVTTLEDQQVLASSIRGAKQEAQRVAALLDGLVQRHRQKLPGPRVRSVPRARSTPSLADQVWQKDEGELAEVLIERAAWPTAEGAPAAADTRTVASSSSGFIGSGEGSANGGGKGAEGNGGGNGGNGGGNGGNGGVIGGPLPPPPPRRHRSNLAPVAPRHRDEWFEMQATLEAMQAAQVAAICMLERATAMGQPESVPLETHASAAAVQEEQSGDDDQSGYVPYMPDHSDPIMGSPDRMHQPPSRDQ